MHACFLCVDLARVFVNGGSGVGRSLVFRTVFRSPRAGPRALLTCDTATKKREAKQMLAPTSPLTNNVFCGGCYIL